MYKIGTRVSYRSEGVCVITEIRRQKFGVLNELKDFYILSPIKEPNSKLFVPADNEDLVSKMRPLCSAEEVNQLAKKLYSERLEWIALPRARSNYFRDILSDGDRNMLILLIHTIYEMEEQLAPSGRHVTQGDLNAFNRAKKVLLAELSVTTDISTEQELLSVINCEIECHNK